MVSLANAEQDMIKFRNKQHGNSRAAPQPTSANNHIECHGAESGRDTPSTYPAILASDKAFARLDMITRPARPDE